MPASNSPAMEMRLRVLDAGTDKYGLNAYLYDSTNDGTTNYDRVLFSTTKDGNDAVGDVTEGEWADVKVKISGGALDGKTAGMLVRVEEMSRRPVARAAVPHLGDPRHATWPSWPGEPGYTDFDEYLAAEFPTSTAADFAILEAGITSEQTYVDQGLYWTTGHWPMMEYVAETYQPDLLLAGMPTTDEFQHQFLGLVTRRLPNGQPNPAYDDVNLDGVKDHRVAARERFIRTAYAESDADPEAGPVAGRPQPDHLRGLRPRLRSAVPGHRRQQGAGRHGSALDAADLQLSTRRRRDHRQGEGLLRRRRGAGLPQPRRP